MLDLKIRELQEIRITDVPCKSFLVLNYMKINKNKNKKIDYRKAAFELVFVQY